MHLNLSSKGITSYTKHALLRSHQRSIPPIVIDLLLDFADPTPAGKGAESYSFTKRSWRKAAAYLGPRAKDFEKYRHTYLILASNGQIITIAYQH